MGTGTSSARPQPEPGTEQLTENYTWFENEGNYLGGGSFGHVYKGRDRRTGKVVAVKVFSLPESGDSDTYIEDINLLKNFKSPYVTEYYAAEEVKNSFPPKRAIVMELADGTVASELKKDSNRFGIPKQEFLVLVDNCVRALEYLHIKQLAHRDVKPLNVLVFRKAEEPWLVFKLCDFGTMRLLKARDQIISTYRLAGTPAYWPSWMIEGAITDQRLRYTKDELDVWSTACCFFEAATGRLPFLPRDDRSFEEAMLELLSNRPPNIVCTHFDEETRSYDYLEEMPRQHESYSRSFRYVLGKYFQLLFNEDKAWLELQKFSSLSEEMVSVKEYQYYCLNTSTVELYNDTSSTVTFSRTDGTFLHVPMEIIRRRQMRFIRSSAFGRSLFSISNFQ